MDARARDIARMIDCAGVSGGFAEPEVDALAALAKKHRFIGAHVMPCYVERLSLLLHGEDDILIGSVVGFPSGTHTTATKVFEARQLIEQGCRELDMVINVGALRSGRVVFCRDEIKAVVEVAEGRAVKVILETHYLDPGQIEQGCHAAVEAGAAFVKTSTGWAATGATVEHVALMKRCVGDAIGIKAAGGIRDLATLLRLLDAGATRFGVGMQAAAAIMLECSTPAKART